MGKAARAKGKRAQRQQQAREAILTAAKQLFAAEGVAGLSMRAIAKRAGMPAMTLYTYFPGKMGIVRALWSEAFVPLLKEMDLAQARKGDAKARLRRVAQTVVDYWMRHRERYRIVFFIEDQRESEDDRWFIEAAHVVPPYRRFAHLIAAARSDPEGDYLREAETLVCALNGIVHALMGLSEYPWGRARFMWM